MKTSELTIINTIQEIRKRAQAVIKDSWSIESWATTEASAADVPYLLDLVERLQKDSMRLDWYFSDKCNVIEIFSNDGVKWFCNYTDEIQIEYDSLRAAIDGAMKVVK